MRLLLGMSLMLASVACSDPFAEANEADTIEAYEAYLSENPDGRWVPQATTRLEQLMLEKARREQTMEAFDAYLTRFPEGVLRADAVKEREAVMFESAKRENTKAAWEKFLEEYPKANKKKKQFAKRMLKVAEYLPGLEQSPVRMEQVNLAEDPDGPLDGWGFEVDVTNSGTKTLTDVLMTIQYLAASGRVLKEKEYPLVISYSRMPIEEERLVPFKPGQTRTWVWTTGNTPDQWDRKVNVYVSRVVEAE